VAKERQKCRQRKKTAGVLLRKAWGWTRKTWERGGT